MENRGDIEQLFKNSFDDFEADVHPDAWMNIQSGMNIQPVAHAASTSNGVSAAVKVAAVSSKLGITAIIGSVVAVLSITTAVVYFSSENKKPVEEGLISVVASDNKIVTIESNSEQKLLPSVKNSGIEKSSSKINSDALISKKQNHVKKQTDIYLSSTDNTIATIPVSTANADGQAEQEEKTSSEIKQLVPSQKTNNVIQDSKEADHTNGLTTDKRNDLKTEETKQESSPKSTNYYLGQIPDVITPNQDGKNDVFIINGTDLQSLKVLIYERSGKLIHQWNNLHGFWDGKSENGVPAVEGVYFYDIFARTSDGLPVVKKGSFHLFLK